MRTQRFKITLVLLFVGLITVTAQKKLEKKYTERFTVNKDVVIDIDTRYTDIEIETWNKNEVVIDAYIDITDEVDQKLIDDFLEKWKFEAMGNKSNITISSKSSGLIDIYSFDFDSPNYDILYESNIQSTLDNLQFVIPDLSEMPEIPEMPEIMFELPEMPEMPEMPELPPLPSPFDFKAYKKDKNYLERWKKENEDILGENAKIKVGRNSISIDSNDNDPSFRWNISTEGQNQLAKEIEERLKESEVRRKAREIEIKVRMKERQKEMKLREVEIKDRMKERTEERKLSLIKRQEAHEKRSKEMVKHRVEVREILAKRENTKIKHVIRIKAPKGAKFNMNVRYGSMSFPKE